LDHQRHNISNVNIDNISDIKQYKNCDFTIRLISRELDRVDIFTALIDERIGNKILHPLKQLEIRNELKTKTRWLYENMGTSTYVIRKNNEFVGFAVLILDNPKVPVVDYIYIVPHFRKTVALSFLIDFGMNYLLPGLNIKIDSQHVPGFKKMCMDGTSIDTFWVVYIETANRAKKICDHYKRKYYGLLQ